MTVGKYEIFERLFPQVSFSKSGTFPESLDSEIRELSEVQTKFFSPQCLYGTSHHRYMKVLTFVVL
jgi:hypothetical protein